MPFWDRSTANKEDCLSDKRASSVMRMRAVDKKQRRFVLRQDQSENDFEGIRGECGGRGAFEQ